MFKGKGDITMSMMLDVQERTLFIEGWMSSVQG